MKKLIHHISFTFLYRMNLMKKLLVSYVIVLIIPLLLLTFFSYAHVSRTLIEQFQYSSDMSLQQTSIYLNRIQSDIIDSSKQIAYNKMFTDTYNQNTSANALLEHFEDYTTVHNIAEGIFSSDALYSVELYTNGKYVLEQSNGTEGISFISLENDFAREADARLAKFRGEILWLPPRTIKTVFTSQETPVVTGIRYIKSTKNYKNIGILAVNVQQQALNDIVSRSPILSNSLSLLFDGSGNILAVSDHKLFQDYGISSELILENIALCHTSFQIDRNTMLLNYTPIGESDWTLVSLIPYDEMLKTSTNTRNRMILIMLAVSSLFCFVAYFISRLITKRIRFLATRMKKAQFDNYAAIPSSGGTDEVSDLINSYNHLLNKINHYAESQYQLGVELKNTELKALQAQINPHFLYNTLDLLHWLALDYGASEISEIVSLLSKFYKLSLSKGMEVVTVKDAVKHIEVYVKLQNFRFDNSIQLNLNINPEMNNYGILKLLLQPIVENAILHGILEKEIQEGTITITGDVADHTLCFTIADNGIGMTGEQIERLMNPGEAADTTASHGYGIQNVIKRIHLYYGEEYGLSYESRPNEGTRVFLSVPCRDM